ncbi:MAG: putative lipid II flippase FtsW [Gammaproteobacteria bacterium]|nr:putative lipid II flippase FtsW [Gammaproteobacteria bacterium]
MDYWIIGSSLVLITLGLIMVGSASVSVAEKYSGDPFYYLWRQLLFTAVGVVALLMTLRIPMKFWESLGLVLIISSGVLLALVFIPGLGRTVNGSARWVNLAGFTMQPSEMVKLFCIIYMAGYLVRHQQAIHDSLAGFVRPLLLMMVIVVLLLLEPDFGSIAVLMVTIIALMWLAGVPISRFALLSGLGLILLVIIALGAQYRTQRLTTFLHPWDDPFNSGFQLTQALIAFGRGEWFGVGLGASVQKLFYLPEAHTDFLFAVLAEELGLVGVVAVIGLYVILVARALHIGRSAEKRQRPFAAFIAYGIGIWIGLQAFINMGVNMGVLPTKGLTLPFMSYGGSSIVVMCVALGMLLRVDMELRLEGRRSQPLQSFTW